MISFKILVDKPIDGYGYLAHWGKFQTWALTREEAIKDILRVIEIQTMPRNTLEELKRKLIYN